LLAHSKGYRIGEIECLAQLNAVNQFLIDQFYDSEVGIFADERSSDLSVLSDYRGQKANMHLCEAYITAYEATKNEKFLTLAQGQAKRFVVDFAALADGLIWEHYHADWSVNWDYNIDKPDDLFCPWGFQSGHQVEWAKLLLQLNMIESNEWYVQRAAELFNGAMECGWDHEYGGIVYGFAPDGSFADDHKYFWVHAEAFAAAFRLYSVTGDCSYLRWYERIWEFAWEYLVDHSHGAWFRIRDRRGQAIDTLKSPMGKVDYHTLGACWDVLDQIQDTNPVTGLDP
jgi:mannose/cellobiose epimerase-like protein (N-acyl-D-glucosamine 2-epimerase family)